MEEVEVYINSFLTSALDGVSGQPYVTTALSSGKDPRVLRELQNRSGRF
jgi:hypothetical protein